MNTVELSYWFSDTSLGESVENKNILHQTSQESLEDSLVFFYIRVCKSRVSRNKSKHVRITDFSVKDKYVIIAHLKESSEQSSIIELLPDISSMKPFMSFSLRGGRGSNTSLAALPILPIASANDNFISDVSN